MIGSAGSFWLLVLTSSSDAKFALSLFGIVCRALGSYENWLGKTFYKEKSSGLRTILKHIPKQSNKKKVR